MIRCKICNKELKSYKSFAGHLPKHKITSKEYYDTYLKQPNEGICLVCGKETRFMGIIKGYKQFCSLKCATPHAQESGKITLQKRYNVTNFGQTPEAIKKKKATVQKRYNVDYSCTTEKCIKAAHSEQAKQKQKETFVSKYNVSCGFNTTQCREASKSEKAKKKREQTNLKKYGSKITFKNNHTTQANLKRNTTMIDKYGYKYAFMLGDSCSEEATKKKHDTRLKNGWLQHKDEKQFAYWLDSRNIVYKHNYKSNIYPWKVDFYLPNLDLYIELNLSWEHGFHFYNEETDKITIEKFLTKNTEHYKKAIYTWTKSDLKKRDWAIVHKLNYVVLWNIKQINMFFEDLDKNKQFLGFIDYNHKAI